MKTVTKIPMKSGRKTAPREFAASKLQKAFPLHKITSVEVREMTAQQIALLRITKPNTVVKVFGQADSVYAKHRAMRLAQTISPNGKVKIALPTAAKVHPHYKKRQLPPSKVREIQKKYVVLIGYLKNAMAVAAELEREIGTLQPDDCGVPSTGLFRPFVDEKKLADCFYTLYAGFFGVEKEFVLEDKRDEVDFACYLFILVDRKELGRNDFRANGKKPFYEFIQKYMVVDLDITDRGFRSRLDKYGDFHDKVMKMNAKDMRRGDPDCRNFHRLLENFHKSDYYKELKKYLRASK